MTTTSDDATSDRQRSATSWRPRTLVAEGVGKTYARAGRGRRSTPEPTQALRDVGFSVAPGEFLTILGPSGCGKSTLLAAIAGLTSYDAGRIEFDGVPISGPGLERAVVFQQASLLPWRTVRDNVRFGLQMQRELGAAEIEERVAAGIHTVNLDGFEDFYPGQLSGGMQQRVNLARALATRPDLLLMDEPFAAVDALTKETLQDELARISDETSCSIVFVTHDIEEAVFLGDHVLVMSPRPGTVLTIEPTPWPRPRSRELFDDPNFRALSRRLRTLITSQ